LIEVAICLGGFGVFTTLFLLFIKLFPCVSVAETLQGQAATVVADGDKEVRHAQ
jgi:hypothetical protein